METSSSELNHVRHWHVAAPKGRMVYDAGDPALAFYRVEKGCIRLQLTSEDGHRQILAFCLPGDIFGLEIGKRHFEAAEAATDSQLSRFATAAIIEPPLDLVKVAAAFGAASNMTTRLFTHLAGLGRGSADERLMWFLNWLADRQGVADAGGGIRLPMNRRDIADFLGLAQETLSRTFARLEARGDIEFGARGAIRVRPGGERRSAPSARRLRPAISRSGRANGGAEFGWRRE